MPRSLIVTVLLLSLAAGSLSYIHASVDANQDTVTIDETVMYGDKSVAEGIAVDLNIQSDYRLFWDTRYTVGQNPEISTNFTFSQAKKQPNDDRSPSVIYLDTAFGGGYGASGTNLDLTHEAIPVQDVASRAEPGKKHTEVVYLKDYYDYYPISVHLDRTPRFAINEETQKIFANYFRIPVYPEHQVKISIEKDSAGNVHRLEMQTVEGRGVQFHMASTIAGNNCFFTISALTESGKLLDTSSIPGGYGIYHFPLSSAIGDARILHVDELQTVFTLDAERARVVTLQTSQDKSKLLLVTIEDGTYLLTVIDAATMTQLQKLEILEVEQRTGRWYGGSISLHIYNDFIVAVASDGRFKLFALTEAGSLVAKFTASFSEHFQDNDELRYVFSGFPSMDYDGEKLVVAGFQDGYFAPRNYCSFYLGVYDASGLVYAGHYQHSLDKSRVNSYQLTCRPVDTNSLTVTWGR